MPTLESQAGCLTLVAFLKSFGELHHRDLTSKPRWKCPSCFLDLPLAKVEPHCLELGEQ